MNAMENRLDFIDLEGLVGLVQILLQCVANLFQGRPQITLFIDRIYQHLGDHRVTFGKRTQAHLPQ